MEAGAAESTLAGGVQCCSTSGDTCFRDGSTNKNYADSVDICTGLGMRLCTVAETDTPTDSRDGLCCGKGYSIDFTTVWALEASRCTNMVRVIKCKRTNLPMQHPRFFVSLSLSLSLSITLYQKIEQLLPTHLLVNSAPALLSFFFSLSLSLSLYLSLSQRLNGFARSSLVCLNAAPALSLSLSLSAN